MMPKQFLVEDVSRQLGAVLVELADVRRRLLHTQKVIESQRRMIEALRKRVDRQGARLRSASHGGVRRPATKPSAMPRPSPGH